MGLPKFFISLRTLAQKMDNELKSSKSDIFALILIVVALFGAYSPSYLGVYGFSDDYSTYFAANLSHTDFIKWDVMSGRPLYAALRYIAQNFIKSTSDFTIFRIFSVLSIISLGCYLYFFLKKAQFPGGMIAWCATPILLCCLPSIALFGAWATCFPYVTSILLAGLSYSALNYSPKLNAFLRLTSSVILLSLSFAIYQPTGMAFSLFMLIDNCLNESALKVKKVLQNVIAIILGMASSLIFSKAIPIIVYGQSFSRSALADSLKEKIVWFFDKPFHDAISNYSIFHTSTYFTISLLIFLLSLALICVQKDGIKKFLLAVAVVVGSFSPNLIIAESWVSYRSLVSLELCVGVLLAFSLAKTNTKWQLRSVTMLLCAAYAILSCNLFIYTNFVKQFNQETIVLKSAIKDKIAKDYNGYLMFDISSPEWNVFSPTKYDEIGAPSIQISWAISGLADSLKKEMGYNFKINNERTDGSVLTAGSNACSENCTVIEVTKKLRAIKD